MNRLAAFAPLVALVLAVILFAGWSLWGNPHVTPMALVGKPVPDVTLAALDGGSPVALPVAAKGPVLINFYASWCAPCAQEAPALLALKAEGVRIIGVAYKDDPAAASGFLTRLGNPYAQVLTDRDGRGGMEFGVTGVPETYAVDAKGVIRGKRASPIDAGDAEALVRAAGW
jgi:cytochrome c biogenesis protein CcmG, thiol:disulfide interchange protein DsbE